MNLIAAERWWPANVRAAFTPRAGGASAGVYVGNNMSLNVGDAAAAVVANRSALCSAIGARAVAFVEQVHGNRVVAAEAAIPAAGSPAPGIVGEDKPQQADALVAGSSGIACAIMVADCLPVLLATRDGALVAAVHCGWRGLAGGVLAASVAALVGHRPDIVAWLGPRIGRACYEVGDEVREQFALAPARCFQATRPGHALCDLAGIARWQLQDLGIDDVVDADICAFTDAARCYSYRRDRVTGRNAAVIVRF